LTRIWKPGVEDDGSIHCLGNGRLAVYERGPEIIQAFGPPYSTGSLLKILPEGDDLTEIRSVREEGTAVWTHTVAGDRAPAGAMTDFIDSELPCFVRVLRLERPLCFLLEAEKGRTVTDLWRIRGDRGIAADLLVTAEPGCCFYRFYPSPRRHYLELAATGNVSVRPGARDGTWRIECGAGESVLYLAGGPEYPDAVCNTEKALRTGAAALLERTRSWWLAFGARRRDFPSLIPASFPLRRELLERVDCVSVLLRTQQAAEGGFLAGHNYHMGYVRDQYGVSRCLLALGYHEEARALLLFYWGIWSAHGAIHNAQALGLDGSFHIHENDEVEITAYLIIQAFDYLTATGDGELPARIAPMLFWAWDAQKKWIVEGMLPFNGDETYVAGGILPRTALNDGSAEATLLFVTAGERLLAWAEGRGVRSRGALEEDRRVLASVRGSYRANFLRGGALLANNPLRAERADVPRFRHGVCEGCGTGRGIGWTERNRNGRYLCPVCSGSKDLPAVPAAALVIQSVALTPSYFGSDLIGREELSRMTASLLSSYRETGRLPSRPDGDIAVGYDYGLLLYALTVLGDPAAGGIFWKMLSVADSTGVWVEYYRNHAPTGCRYRPWESGINLEAGLRYALSGGGGGSR